MVLVSRWVRNVLFEANVATTDLGTALSLLLVDVLGPELNCLEDVVFVESLEVLALLSSIELVGRKVTLLGLKVLALLVPDFIYIILLLARSLLSTDGRQLCM